MDQFVLQEGSQKYKMDFKKEEQSGSRKFVYIAVFTCNIISLTAGMAETWSSPMLPKLSNETHIDENPLGELLDKDQQSWVGSLLALGAIFGPLPTGIAAGTLGRRFTIIALGIPYIISFFTLAFAKTVYLFYFARFLVGFGNGAVFTVVPMYIGEISEDSNRGMFGSAMNCFLTAGLLFSYAVGPYLPIIGFNIFCAIFPCIFVVLFYFFIPESPFYLIAKNKPAEAEAALIKLRGKPSSAVQKELQDIKKEVEKAAGGSFTDIFKSKGLKKGMIISSSLIALQQFSGINIVLFYTQDVFEATGSSIPAEISAIVIGGVQFLASFVTPPLVDRLGRKILLITSAAGMFLAEAVLGLFFFLKEETDVDVSSVGWLPILCLIVYIISYNLGFGPIPWALMGELFPSNVKSGASTVTTCTCWILGFIIAKFFNDLTDVIGIGPSFWIFACFCIVAIVFVVTYVPETKGKSFLEIQDILSK